MTIKKCLLVWMFALMLALPAAAQAQEGADAAAATAEAAPVTTEQATAEQAAADAPSTVAGAGEAADTAAAAIAEPSPLVAQQAFETIAKQAIVVDAETGTVLLDKGANTQMPTSSMSKVMTMYMVFEALKGGHISLTDQFTISEKAWRMQGSKMFIQVGTTVSVEDLIRGVIIQSGNDATVALAEGISGSEESFVDAMNARAKELGMTNSHFMNASGWPDPDHYSTPRDLALLAYRIMNDFPEYYPYFSEKEFTYNNIKQQNRDPLLGRLPGADGLKTGHTDIAGYGLIGSAKREGRRVIMVVNGLESIKDRGDESVRIMEWAFRTFEWKTLVAKDQEVETAKVWLGEEAEVPLMAEKDLKVVLPRAQMQGITMKVNYTMPIEAPVKKGDAIAKLKVEIPGQEPVEMNMLAARDVARLGIFGRVKARLSYLISGNE